MKWMSIEVALPVTNEKFGDSEFCIVFNDVNGDKAVAWYNSIEKVWKISHSLTPSTPIAVTHWKLFKEPKL